MKSILLIEDDRDLGFLLKHYLEKHGFSVLWLENGLALEENIGQEKPSLVLLDINLPSEDGFALAERLKQAQPLLPFIFLTARALKDDQLRGLRLGADDYLVKPVDEDVLVAKLRAILRRTHMPSELQIGGFVFHPATQALEGFGQLQRLTEKESQLLVLLYQHRGTLLTREQALRSLWGRDDFFTRKTMDVYLSRLRRRLKADVAIQLRNVRGKGYIFDF